MPEVREEEAGEIISGSMVDSTIYSDAVSAGSMVSSLSSTMAADCVLVRGGDGVTPYGSFSGNPRTEWLPNGRDMVVLERFSYTDPAGRVWWSEIGDVTNGASIPQALWGPVGSPFTGHYRNASIIHDAACGAVQTAEDRSAADTMFYWGCLAGGCDKAQAWEFYLGVRIGSLKPKAMVMMSSTKEGMYEAPTINLSLDAAVVLHAAA